MALNLLTPGATVKECELHAFELAYLLSIVGVDSVSGLPNAVLFPGDPQVRTKVLREGEKKLIANGWLIPQGKQGGAYNDKLLSMTAAVADPRLSLLTRRESPHGDRADAIIYFNNVQVVEVTQSERQVFRLREVKNAAEAFQRVRKMLGVTPQPRHANTTVELRIEVFEKVRQHIQARNIDEAVDELVEVEMARDAAEDFVAAMATPERKGTVSILKHVAHKVTDVRVLGYYLCKGGAWITSVVAQSSNLVRIEGVDTNGFIRRLVDRVAGIDG